LWKIAKEFYGNPSRDLKLIGVTGTNGKTTTAWILRQMLGQESAYIGTLGFYTPSGGRPLSNTTPFTLDLNEMIAEAKSEGVSAVTLEV
ncbi:Mur ligase family protein, partial [Shewanella indica]|uniref:Mur ligase family protein n=1 Tax=Shewanella indica TaxID=768528 RepID=UPI00313B4714